MQVRGTGVELHFYGAPLLPAARKYFDKNCQVR